MAQLPPPLPPFLAPTLRDADSPRVTTGGGHTAAGVGIPGTVGVPGEDTVYTEAVLGAVRQRQLNQLGAGAGEEHLLQEEKAEGEPRHAWGRGMAEMCPERINTLGPPRKKKAVAGEQSRPGGQIC